VTGKIEAGHFGGARDVRAYTAEDMRFTTKGDALYAFIMVWPESGSAVIKSLATGSQYLEGKVENVSLLGSGEKIDWTQDDRGLNVKLPATPPSASAVTLKIRGVLAA
jgi:alpha-L-fucosidase